MRRSMTGETDIQVSLLPEIRVTERYSVAQLGVDVKECNWCSAGATVPESCYRAAARCFVSKQC